MSLHDIERAMRAHRALRSLLRIPAADRTLWMIPDGVGFLLGTRRHEATREQLSDALELHEADRCAALRSVAHGPARGPHPRLAPDFGDGPLALPPISRSVHRAGVSALAPGSLRDGDLLFGPNDTYVLHPYEPHEDPSPREDGLDVPVCLLTGDRRAGLLRFGKNLETFRLSGSAPGFDRVRLVRRGRQTIYRDEPIALG